MPQLNLPQKRQLDILIDFEQGITFKQLCQKYGHDYTVIKRTILTKYTQEQIASRFRLLCRENKLGKKNPMFGKTGQKHPNYVPIQKAVTGYLRTRDVPDWYTGARSDGRVYLHILKYCEYAGLTEIPGQKVVHHIDGKKQNNSKENLMLMSIGQHMKHHALEKKKRKEQRLSRKGVGNSVPEAPNIRKDDDIV